MRQVAAVVLEAWQRAAVARAVAAEHEATVTAVVAPHEQTEFASEKFEIRGAARAAKYGRRAYLQFMHWLWLLSSTQAGPCSRVTRA